jgi:hypothetical protein
MLLGAVLMVVGCLLVIRNKDVAILIGTDQRGFYSEFGRSVARQNIAIIGSLVFGAGIAMFALM